MTATIENIHTANCLGCSPEKNKESEALRTLFITDQCKVILREDDQSWIGRCIVTPRRHISSFEEFFDEGGAEVLVDLYHCRMMLVKAYRSCFGMTIDNWAQLGNLTRDAEGNFPDDSQFHHIHYHFIPRYKNSVERFGRNFIDKQFGKPLNLSPECERICLTSDQIQELREEIQLELIEQQLISLEHIASTKPTQKVLEALPKS